MKHAYFEKAYQAGTLILLVFLLFQSLYNILSFLLLVLLDTNPASANLHKISLLLSKPIFIFLFCPQSSSPVPPASINTGSILVIKEMQIKTAL